MMADLLRFDEHELATSLQAMAVGVVIGFAAACAERLVALYTRMKVGNRADLSLLRAALDAVWDQVLVGSYSTAESTVILEARVLERLSEDEPGELWDYEGLATADDAMSAVAYALRAATTGEVQQAVWAARRAYERANETAARVLLVDLNDPGAEKLIDSSSWVQMELSRQARDVSCLASASSGEWESRVTTLRERAMSRPGIGDCSGL